MDEIQKVLIKAGRKDLAQKYYEKVAGNNEKTIEIIRFIAENKQYKKVLGVPLDAFTATAMVKLYDALSPESQAKVDLQLQNKPGLLKFHSFAMKALK